jgi:hypothetical protein
MSAYAYAPTSDSCAPALRPCNFYSQVQQFVIGVTTITSYTLTLYTKASSVTGYCTLSLAIGPANPADSSFIMIADFSDDTDWESISYTTIILSNQYLTLRIQCSAGSAGQVWLDRMSLAPTS